MRAILSSEVPDLQNGKMANIVDPILPILSILAYWAIVLGSFGGPGKLQHSKNSKPLHGDCPYMAIARVPV